MSQWTFKTLKEHFDALREDDKQAVAAALASAERAVAKADLAMEKRFDGVNEFRAALSDQAQAAAKTSSEYLTRREFEGQHSAALTAILDLGTRLKGLESRGTGMNTLAQLSFQVILALGVIVTIILSFIKH